MVLMKPRNGITLLQKITKGLGSFSKQESNEMIQNTLFETRAKKLTFSHYFSLPLPVGFLKFHQFQCLFEKTFLNLSFEECIDLETVNALTVYVRIQHNS